MKKNLLVTIANVDYLNQAKQLFSSAYFNAGWDGDYMLLAHEVPDEELTWFIDKGILVKKCEPLISDTYTGTGPIITYDKFYLFTEEFKKWDKIVLIDSDVIIRGSIKSLLKTKAFAAAKDENYDLTAFDLKKPKTTLEFELFNKALQIKNKHPNIFNAGVFVFNTEIISETTFSELMYLKNKFDVINNASDQLIFNLYFNKPIFISNYYNYLINFNKCKKLKPTIIHFAGIPGNEKPWFIESSFYNEWKHNLDKAKEIDLSKVLKKHENLLKKLAFEIIFKASRIDKSIEMFIGKIGIILKKISPRLYRKIKRH